MLCCSRSHSNIAADISIVTRFSFCLTCFFPSPPSPPPWLVTGHQTGAPPVFLGSCGRKWLKQTSEVFFHENSNLVTRWQRGERGERGFLGLSWQGGWPPGVVLSQLWSSHCVRLFLSNKCVFNFLLPAHTSFNLCVTGGSVQTAGHSLAFLQVILTLVYYCTFWSETALFFLLICCCFDIFPFWFVTVYLIYTCVFKFNEATN